MAAGQVRHIKVDFAQNEKFFDHEAATGLSPWLRVAFPILWTQCDRNGVFQWRPRLLKIACLPWDGPDFQEVLDALEKGGYVRRFVGSDGKPYGVLPGFRDHQKPRHDEYSRFPLPPLELVDPEVRDEIRVVEDLRKVERAARARGERDRNAPSDTSGAAAVTAATAAARVVDRDLVDRDLVDRDLVDRDLRSARGDDTTDDEDEDTGQVREGEVGQPLTLSDLVGLYRDTFDREPPTAWRTFFAPQYLKHPVQAREAFRLAIANGARTPAYIDRVFKDLLQRAAAPSSAPSKVAAPALPDWLEAAPECPDCEHGRVIEETEFGEQFPGPPCTRCGGVGRQVPPERVEEALRLQQRASAPTW